jgi:hypothetical protein
MRHGASVRRFTLSPLLLLLKKRCPVLLAPKVLFCSHRDRRAMPQTENEMRILQRKSHAKLYQRNTENDQTSIRKMHNS